MRSEEGEGALFEGDVSSVASRFSPTRDTSAG